MGCPYCDSSATTERPDSTAQGYRRFRCRTCRRGFNERTEFVKLCGVSGREDETEHHFKCHGDNCLMRLS